MRDVLVRAGRNPASGQSALLDLAGGIAAAIGADNQGRSLTASLDGGIELTIGPNKQKKGLRLEIRGDVDWMVKGNFHLNVTGDMVVESAAYQQIAKKDLITKAQNQTRSALVRITDEAPDVVHNQGLYASSPD